MINNKCNYMTNVNVLILFEVLTLEILILQFDQDRSLIKHFSILYSFPIMKIILGGLNQWYVYHHIVFFFIIYTVRISAIWTTVFFFGGGGLNL